MLVNGRRHVAGDILSSGVSPDINTIPTDLIERVDVLTGGASSIYGSDAVCRRGQLHPEEQLRRRAGARPDRHFEVRRTTATSSRRSWRAGFRRRPRHVTVALEFAHTDRAFASGRPNLRENFGFVVTDTDPRGTPNGSDGVFDRTSFRDIRSATISLGGLVAVSQGAGAPCGRTVSPFTCTFLFQRDGTLTPQTGTRIGIGPNGNYQGGDGYTGRGAS